MILSPRSWNLMRRLVLRGVDELGDRVAEHTVQLLLSVAELLVAVAVVLLAEPSPKTVSWILSLVLILCMGGQLWQVAHLLVIPSTRMDLHGQMIRYCPG
jgi:ABC-type polysaccharide/polyol phosphate export permease